MLSGRQLPHDRTKQTPGICLLLPTTWEDFVGQEQKQKKQKGLLNS